MNTAPGRGEEDACSSVLARGRGADAHTSRANRVGADDNQSADGWARGGSKNTQRHRLHQWKWFLYHCSTKWRQRCVVYVRGRPRHTGERRKTCCRKVSKSRSRFSVKLSENKLKEKLDSHLIPENCAEIRAPVLNVEIMEKGNLDRMARKNDAHLLNVQKLITTAATTLVNASDQLHHVTMVLADQSTCGGKQLYPSRFIEAANETLASNSDVIALLGTAQQELSIRRRYQLQQALPKDTALLRSNENIPITDKLFGDDADKAIKTARETFKIKNYQRPHPYKHGQNRPFSGQTPPPPQVQLVGELLQSQGARKTLEPERGREVQG